MGIGYQYGPPRPDGRVDDSWFAERTLSPDQLRDLMGMVEHWGGEVPRVSADSFHIAGDCEAFSVRPEGGWLSKPTLRDEDEHERLTQLMLSICEWAGWICVGDSGLVAGGFLVCGACGASGYDYSCPKGCPRSETRLEASVTAPVEEEDRAPGPLDVLRDASTSGAVRDALKTLERDPPLDDPDVVLSLLLSDGWVERALDAIEQLGPEAFAARASVYDARLRRVAMLSDEPHIASRAKALRR